MCASSGFAQNTNVLDPLNLNKHTNKTVIQKRIIRKSSILTAITADKTFRGLIITGIPEINANVKTESNHVFIEFPNTSLHKSISNPYYNWGLKFSNQLPEIINTKVLQNDLKKNILVELTLEYPVVTSIVRNSPSKIAVNFEKVPNRSLNKSTIKQNLPLTNKEGNNEIKIKPSGKFATINPGTQGLNTPNNTKPLADNRLASNNINTSPTNKELPLVMPPKLPDNAVQDIDVELPPTVENDLSDIPPDLPMPPRPKNLDIAADKPAPGNYQRSENDFAKTPTELPTLDRPETINNNLLESHDYDDLIRIAISLESEQKLDDAIQKYSQAVTVNPNRYEAYSALGDIYLRQEKYDLAIENYEKSLSLNKNQAKTAYNLANSYNKKADYPKAISNFEKVLSIQPNNYEATYNLAYIYYLVNDYTNAVKYYQNCLTLSKKSKNNVEIAKIHYNIANTYKAQKDLERAIKEYTESIKLYKEFADAYYNLAATYIDIGNSSKAIAEFQNYIKYTSSQSEIDRVKKVIDQLKKSS